MDVLLWGVLPYLVIATLVLGTIWRYRYDKFGWTTRSSQLYESRLLRIGSPLFHFGILVVFIGHIGGLVVPEDWTEAVGVSEGMYHFNALLFGGIAGFCTLAGIIILVVRRRRTGPVFMATTVNDKVMYVLLVGAGHYKNYVLDAKYPNVARYYATASSHPAFYATRYPESEMLAGWGEARGGGH